MLQLNGKLTATHILPFIICDIEKTALINVAVYLTLDIRYP